MNERHKVSSELVKAYIMLEMDAGKVSQALDILRSQRVADSVEQLSGPPDILMIVTAMDLNELTLRIVKAINAVNFLTTDEKILQVVNREY